MKYLAAFLLLVASALGQSITATEGQSGTFTASAQGSAPLAWQWYFAPTGQGADKALPIPGATLPTYTIPKLEQKHAGIYFVRVSNSAGSAQSDNLVFIVALRAPTKPEVRFSVGP